MATDVISAPRRPPVVTTGLWGWLRTNLFSSIPNTLLTLVLLYVIFRAVTGAIGWALTTDGWVALQSNVRLLMVGPYPPALVWRVELGVWLVLILLGLSAGIHQGVLRALAIGAAIASLLLAPILFTLPPPATPTGNPLPPLLFLLGNVALLAGGYALGARFPDRLRLPVNVLWFLAYPVIMIFVIRGSGAEGPFEAVETNLWGGLLVTVALATIGIVASFPLGVLLALGRRSKLPVVKAFCTLYIEVIRGVPLITVLYIGSLILPLFLPRTMEPPSGLVRAMVAITLFSAAYLAENVRGGLQSLPKGQTEAAQALGMSYFQTTLLITLPQALRAVIPALVGQFISLFKDTSLVAIVGLFDLLGIAQQVSRQPDWLGIPGGVNREMLVTISIIYFVVCFTMSRISQRVERRLGVGER